MTEQFSKYVTKHEVVTGKNANRACSFCHFDANAKIAEYVVHYLKELKDAGCDVYFVSNNEAIANEYLESIRPYVTEIILRKNEGYDFAAYFTGYEYAKENDYAELIFANDSAYGPFYALGPIFEKMAPCDMWAVSDAPAGHYHLQSYFWVFRLGLRMRAFLEREIQNFVFTSVKADVVGMYEEGISKRLAAEKFNIGVLCKNEDANKIEKEKVDAVMKALKVNIRAIAGQKVKPWTHVLGWFLPKRRWKNAAKINTHTNGTGIFSNWYAMVKYMDCPFIKVGMVKKHSMEKYHEFKYMELLAAKYPAYDLNLIENHRKGQY